MKSRKLLRELLFQRGDSAGKIFLYSLPGRDESIEDFQEAIADAEVTKIFSLVEFEERKSKSPKYHEMVVGGLLPCDLVEYPIPDYTRPGDMDSFCKLIVKLADEVMDGKNLLVHCAAGWGRTGFAAFNLLLALGYEYSDAAKAVLEAGSSPPPPLFKP
jgi:predicted protein tyrosine phosphatase